MDNLTNTVTGLTNTVTDLTVIHIDEDGKISLKNISVRANTKRYEMNHYFDDAFECRYCMKDSCGRGSIGPFIFPDAEPEDTAYVMNYSDNHKKNCICPVNPHSYLMDASCSCGMSEHGRHRGKIFFVKVAGQDNERGERNCDQHDLDCFMQYLKDSREEHITVEKKPGCLYRFYQYVASWFAM